MGKSRELDRSASRGSFPWGGGAVDPLMANIAPTPKAVALVLIPRSC